jgi:hypothetical protein
MGTERTDAPSQQRVLIEWDALHLGASKMLSLCSARAQQ